VECTRTKEALIEDLNKKQATLDSYKDSLDQKSLDNDSLSKELSHSQYEKNKLAHKVDRFNKFERLGYLNKIKEYKDLINQSQNALGLLNKNGTIKEKKKSSMHNWQT